MQSTVISSSIYSLHCLSTPSERCPISSFNSIHEGATICRQADGATPPINTASGVIALNYALYLTLPVILPSQWGLCVFPSGSTDSKDVGFVVFIITKYVPVGGLGRWGCGREGDFHFIWNPNASLCGQNFFEHVVEERSPAEPRCCHWRSTEFGLKTREPYWAGGGGALWCSVTRSEQVEIQPSDARCWAARCTFPTVQETNEKPALCHQLFVAFLLRLCRPSSAPFMIR